MEGTAVTSRPINSLNKVSKVILSLSDVFDCIFCG